MELDLFLFVSFLFFVFCFAFYFDIAAASAAVDVVVVPHYYLNSITLTNARCCGCYELVCFSGWPPRV